jgi:hypothetical protein
MVRLTTKTQLQTLNYLTLNFKTKFYCFFSVIRAALPVKPRK